MVCPGILAAEHLLGVHSAVRLLRAAGASCPAPGRTGVWGRSACHGGHAAFYAGGTELSGVLTLLWQRYAADRSAGKAAAPHSPGGGACRFGSAVCPDPQCLSRLSGLWQSVPLAAAQTLYANYVTAYFGFYPWGFYSTGLFRLSAVAVSVLGRVNFLYGIVGRQRMVALAPLGLPAAGLASAATRCCCICCTSRSSTGYCWWSSAYWAG